MTVVNPKSISGITSITTASGSDDLLTIHTNNGTERLRIDSTGTTKIVTGIVTTLTATTGIVTTLTTNTLTANSTTKVGSGVTLSPDGDIFATGVTTTTHFKVTTGANAFETSANVFKGASGQKGVYLRSALSAEDTPSYSSVDDTNTGIFLPGSDVFGVTTGGSERLRITSGGVVQIGGATENSADIDTSNTKVTIKQSGGSAEDGIYIERVGERRGHYIYVGGGLSQSDALCVTTNQLGTDTDLLAIDRGGDVVVGAGDIFFTTSGKGIVLGATTNSDSNTLDDYEEGVHTMTQLGSGGGVPLSNAVIRYTKIGNICQVSGMLDVGASSGSSSVEISLPFTSKADSGTTKSRSVSALMHKHCDVNNSYINIVGYIGQNENYMRIYNVADNNDWHQFLSGDFSANNAEVFFTFVYQTA